MELITSGCLRFLIFLLLIIRITWHRSTHHQNHLAPFYSSPESPGTALLIIRITWHRSTHRHYHRCPCLYTPNNLTENQRFEGTFCIRIQKVLSYPHRRTLLINLYIVQSVYMVLFTYIYQSVFDPFGSLFSSVWLVLWVYEVRPLQSLQ